MQIQVFSIPMEGDAEATEQLNAFLRSQKVLSIEKAAVAAGGRQYWSVCVEYLPRRGAEGPADRTASKSQPEKARVDYRELLTAPQFARFSKLRELRKELADSEGVPVYTLFTNALLAEVATKVPGTRDALAAIDGLGEAKVKKYGELLLDLMARMPMTEEERAVPAIAGTAPASDVASAPDGARPTAAEPPAAQVKAIQPSPRPEAKPPEPVAALFRE